MSQYVAFTYSGEVGVPPPMDAITDPTPAERAEQEARMKAEHAAAKAAAATGEASKLEEKKKSILGKITSVAEEVVTTAQKTATAAVSTVQTQARRLVDEHATKRFAAALPALAMEPLLGDYACKALVDSSAGPFTLNGNLAITDKHVCFVCDHKPSSVAIPVEDVVSLKLAVVLPTEHGTPPFVLPLPAPRVIPTVIQIYVKTESKMHQFGYFTNFREAVNVLDHAVRAAVSFPVPGVKYEQ